MAKKKKKGINWLKVKEGAKQGAIKLNKFFLGANKGLDKVMGTK